MTVFEASAERRHGSATAPEGSGRFAGREELVVLCALTLLAALIRFTTLSQQSFWLDEGYTERLVRMSLWSMLHTIPHTESTPPLYYVVAWIWTRVFGFTEFGLRSLSALAGAMTVPVTYVIARRVADRRAAVIAGLLLATSPLLVWFSQEARAYALATLFATLTVLCIVQYRGTGLQKWLTWWAITAAIGLATHYFVGFLVLPELVWLVGSSRRNPRVQATAAAVIAVAIVLAPLALAQRGTGHADYISQGSLLTRLLQLPKQFLVGYASPSQVLTTTLATVVVAAALFGLARARSEVLGRIVLLAVIGLTGVLAPILLAIVGVDFLNTRNLLPCLPTLIVVLAVGLGGLRLTYGAGLAAALAAVFLAVVILVDTHAQFQRDNWRAASRAVDTSPQPRIILVSPASGQIPLGVYQHGLQRLRGAVRVAEIDVIALPPHAVGRGIGHAPRFAFQPLLPPGFLPVAARTTGTYSAERFKASADVTVTSATFAAARRRGFLALSQSPSR